MRCSQALQPRAGAIEDLPQLLDADPPEPFKHPGTPHRTPAVLEGRSAPTQGPTGEALGGLLVHPHILAIVTGRRRADARPPPHPRPLPCPLARPPRAHGRCPPV